MKNKKQILEAAAFDRGATPYFHGRNDILDNFENILDRANRSKTGTTFLIQGAPGIGKTALLHECEKLAVDSDWVAATVKAGALWNSDQLTLSLGKKRKPKVAKISADAGVDNLIKIQGGIEIEFDHPAYAILRLLTDDKKPLLLILDEAQSLGIKDVIPVDHKGVVTDVLDYIHNGGLKRPILLLAAGLGNTLGAFESLGISRFAEGCVVNLSPLSQESARAVIHDWIKEEAKAEGDPTLWIDSISKETHLWPRHVHSYSKHASDYLKANGGIMTPSGLNEVLQRGHEGRIQYYKQRMNKFEGDVIMSMSLAISNIEDGTSFPKELLTDALTEKFGEEKSKVVFAEFIDKGVIAEDGYLYRIPIPSMHDWMKSELIRAQEKIQLITGVQDRSISFPTNSSESRSPTD